MAHPIDDETLAAIRRHWSAVHATEIAHDQIASKRPGPAATGILVRVTPETAESPAWFECLACRAGRRSYRVDVGADPLCPLGRHVAAIARHFAEAHGITEFGAAQIYHGTDEPVLCSYEAASSTQSAQVTCSLCPEGMRRHPLDEPPYGDARSFAYLGVFYPDFARQIARLAPAEQAIQWEAHQRGVLAAASQPAVTKAVKKARRGPRVRRLTQTQMGIQALLLDEVRAGEPITSVVAALSDLARRDPDAYAVWIARQVPVMERHLSNPPEQVAASLGEWYGKPARTERALWSIWTSIPEPVRLEAERTGTARPPHTPLH